MQLSTGRVWMEFACRDTRDKIVGFHTRYTTSTLRSTADAGPLTPRHKGAVYLYRAVRCPRFSPPQELSGLAVVIATSPADGP